MNPTEEFIGRLKDLKTGELGLLRVHAGQRLDQSTSGFDLFTGLWWPLRAESKRVPRRAVAWLVAKLYAFRPVKHSRGETLAFQLGRVPSDKSAEGLPVRQRFDRLLTLPLDKIEPALQWALDLIASDRLSLDWVELTDDLSLWEREAKRLKWAEEFLKSSKEDRHAN